MTVQVPVQQRYRRQRWSRLIFTGLTVVFLIGVAIVWIANLGSVLAGVLSIVFTLLGILIACLTWRPQPRVTAPGLAIGVAAGEQGQRPLYEQIDGVALEVDRHKGALVVYTSKALRGATINLSFGFHNSHARVDLAASVVGRRRKGNTVYVAIFPSLEPGRYTLHTDAREAVTKVSIVPGRVEEVDWR